MAFTPNVHTVVTVAFAHLNNGMPPICGQVWMQEDRKMTDTKYILPSCGKEQVTLAGVLDALK
jgi:hypothetical protein